MKTICSSCFMGCETGTESGKFDANGRAGTIKGNIGDRVISSCCGSSVEEIDADLHDWWLELRNLAEEKDVEWLVSDYPEDHRDSFENGDSVQDALDAETDAACSSL